MRLVFLLLITNFLFLSCDKIYELEERYTVEIKVEDTQALPLPKITAELYPQNVSLFNTSSPYSFHEKGLIFPISEDRELISFGQTNANGEVKLHFPAPDSGLNQVSILFYDENEEHKPLKVIALEENFVDQFLSISNLTLYKYNELVSLIIDTDLADNTRLVDYSLNGNIAFDELVFSENTKTFDMEASFAVQINQSIQLNYTLEEFTNEGIITFNEEVFIDIDQENVAYIIQNP